MQLWQRAGLAVLLVMSDQRKINILFKIYHSAYDCVLMSWNVIRQWNENKISFVHRLSGVILFWSGFAV